jgi:hypothetical protein
MPISPHGKQRPTQPRKEKTKEGNAQARSAPTRHSPNHHSARHHPHSRTLVVAQTTVLIARLRRDESCLCAQRRPRHNPSTAPGFSPTCTLYSCTLYCLSPLTLPAQSPNDAQTDPPPAPLSTRAPPPPHALPSPPPSPPAQTPHPDRSPSTPSAPSRRPASPD